MPTKQMISASAAISLFFALCGFAAGQTEDNSVKEHVEYVTEGAHGYQIKMGGTLDEFNTAQYLETYGSNMRLESKFQPNKFLIIENVGNTDVV